MPLKIDVKPRNEETLIEFSGQFDEDASISDIRIDEKSTLVFDWDKVSSINSCGIREWVHFVEKLPEQLKVTFINCPRIIVNQILMINGFILKSFAIKSFYVPYFCEKCEIVKSVLFSEGREYLNGAVNHPPEQECEKCHSKMEMDVTESSYFRFLKNSYHA